MQHRLGHIWFCAMKIKEELLPPGFLQIELQLHPLAHSAGKKTSWPWPMGMWGSRYEHTIKGSVSKTTLWMQETGNTL